MTPFTMAVRRWLKPFVLLICVAMLIIFGVVSCQQRRMHQQLKEKASSLRQKLGELEQAHNALSEQLAHLNEDAAIERIARDQLGMVRPGEILFKTPQTAGVSSEPD